MKTIAIIVALALTLNIAAATMCYSCTASSDNCQSNAVSCNGACYKSLTW